MTRSADVPCALPGKVYGIILAGGQSRRMGRDKASVLCGGRSLLALVKARLEPQCAGLVVSRQSGVSGPPKCGLPVVEDDIAGHAGPLAGILAGLDWLARHRAGAMHAVVAAVDTPFLPLDLVERLAAERDRTGAVLACAASGERRHPAVGLWPVALRHALRSFLVEESLRKLGAFLDRHPLAVAAWPAHPFDPFSQPQHARRSRGGGSCWSSDSASLSMRSPEDVASGRAAQ